MLGSLTTPGRAATRADAADRVAFRLGNAVGTRDKSAFAAQWPACTLPCRRFAVPLTGANARLGASVGRYTFTAEDFHLLLLAGLPAHYQPEKRLTHRWEPTGLCPARLGWVSLKQGWYNLGRCCKRAIDRRVIGCPRSATRKDASHGAHHSGGRP
jgi:hypothetical protein